MISVLILPLFVVVARKMGTRLREIARHAMEANAQMNAMMNETLNLGGALLVKLFGRRTLEIERFQGRAASVRDIGIQRAVVGTSFFVIIGLVSAIGTALVYSIAGYLVIENIFTVGPIVAFGAYLTSLYSALQSLLRDLPITMLVSTHDMKLVQELFPRTIVMDEGLIVADGATKDILADEPFLTAHGLEKP